MPPACFSSDYFPRLMQAKGDQGAREVLRGLPVSARVGRSMPETFDIDTEEDLKHASKILVDAESFDS